MAKSVKKKAAVKVNGDAGKGWLVPFVLEKETPGAYRFKEVDADGKAIEGMDNVVVGTLYVRKSAIKGTCPGRLFVNISW